MVDKAIFINNSSAKDSMRQLEIITNNLANSGTTGFRADYETIKQVPASAANKQSRSYSALDKSYSDFNSGPIINTGRDLDVAVSGEGFIAVQSKAGDEAYTRAGNFQVKNGVLTTLAGEVVLGSEGIVTIPDNVQRIVISPDGGIAVKLPQQNDLVTINQIKLANPRINEITKGKDGLFRLPDGDTAQPDAKVKIIPGSLEGSNVNPVDSLTKLIELSRQFDLHTSLMKDFKDNASKANQLLELPR